MFLVLQYRIRILIIIAEMFSLDIFLETGVEGVINTWCSNT